MKNTIITSVSALIFLVIGLLIGKSNKQIEIQTVVKTNIVEKPVDKIVEKIVEKPVVEYVEKYITNVVEKVVEAEISPQHQIALNIYNRIINATYLGVDKLPIGINDLNIKVLMDKKFDDKINTQQITEALEFEARKIGLKINNESKQYLYYEIDIMPIENTVQFAYVSKLSILRDSFLFSTSDKIQIIRSEVWKKSSIGFVGKLYFNQTTFNEDASQKMISFCNRILEAREK